MNKQQKKAALLREREQQLESSLFSSSSSTFRSFKSKLLHPKEYGFSELSNTTHFDQGSAEDVYSDDSENEDKDGICQTADDSDDYDGDQDLLHPAKKRKAAWVDEDDQQTRVDDVAKLKGIRGRRKEQMSSIMSSNYQQMLQKKFAAVMGIAPSWADLDAVDQSKEQQEEDEDEDAIKIGPSLLLPGSGGALPTDHLKHRWVPDLNEDDVRSKKKKYHSTDNNLRTVFSHKHPLALVTRRQVHKRGHGYASIYQIGAGKCFSLEHLFFENFPITSSAFLPGDRKFVLGASFGKHFYTYDLEACKEMRIPWYTPGKPRSMMSMSVLSENEVLFHERDEMTVMDTRTWRPVATMRPPSSIASFCINKSGDTLYSYGKHDGHVYIWDLKTRRARKHFIDEGCINGCCVAISPNSRYLACGSNTGIVNIYSSFEAESQQQPQPLKELKQLVTRVDCLQFNSTSEALVLSSKELPDAVKIAHFPSMRVFSNFPEANSSVGKVVSCSFSPNSGYLSLSLSSGEVKRLRLQYYSQC